MTQEDIIRMARESGGLIWEVDWLFETDNLQRFYQAAFAAGAAAEREACAKVSETLGVHPALNVYNGGPEWYKHGKEIAAAIRARGEVK